MSTRILMLLQNNPYPEDERVRHEATALTAAGYEVSVISPARRGQPAREVVDGVHVYRYRAPFGGGAIGLVLEHVHATAMSAYLSLRVARNGGFDVLHAHNPPDTLAVVAALHKLRGKRFVYDHHDLAPEMFNARFGREGGGLVHRALMAFERLSCRLADHVIATNESYRRVEIDRGGVSPDAITVVRNGPDLDRTHRVEPDPQLRARAGTILGYIGVMGRQDGIDHLLRALAHLVHTLGREDVFCVLVGTGDAWQELRDLASELGLDRYVWFTGYVSDEDVARYLSTADICVVPDPSNPFNDRSSMIKVSEYMALAKPIAAFDLPEHRTTAHDAAIYARPNDDLALARAIAELMDDPERRRRMGEAGRRRVEEELAWKYSIPSLLAAYEQLGCSGANRAASADEVTG
jgi:glycosyltransferase involved in cell wall biosynthesis